MNSNEQNTSVKIIVDESGKSLKKERIYDQIFSFFKRNLGKIIEKGIPLGTVLSTIIVYISTTLYTQRCSTFYGVHERYLVNLTSFWENLFAAVLLLLMAVVSLVELFGYEKKSQIHMILMYIAMSLAIFCQEMFSFLICVLQFDYNAGVVGCILLFLFITSFILVYFFILREWDRKWNKLEEILLSIVLFCYLVCVGLGVSSVIGKRVETVKEYEMISENQVIINEYDGKLLVMECEISDDNELCITKGKYYFIDKENVEIEFRKFNDVRCE